MSNSRRTFGVCLVLLSFLALSAKADAALFLFANEEDRESIEVACGGNFEERLTQ